MIAPIEASLLADIRHIPDDEFAFRVIKPFVGDAIDDASLHWICGETLSFPIPLKPITDRISSLELFHGPTLAFKDIGARFMSRCLRHFSGLGGERTLVIVATSGDTGGAVADGFADVEGIDVVILYPKGKVSRIQELQLTTAGDNVITLEIRGTFDDCQRLAKVALADPEIVNGRTVTSANSINVARWLPQQFYYFIAIKQCNYELAPIFSVPSGNFGNITAGLLAHRRGLPAAGFIAACNANETVPDFLRTGDYQPRPSVQTLSNAMDVGDPSNFARILEIFEHDETRLRHSLKAVSISDDETVAAIRSVHEQYGYLLDPHGAVAFAALESHLTTVGVESEQQGIFLETAHPAKFDTSENILGTTSEIPPTIEHLLSRGKRSIELDADANQVKEAILANL